jgi:cell division protein FtsB
MRDQQERKEALRAEEMQAHMRALLAEKDKKNTEQLVAYECENDQLRREIENLKDFLRAKEDFINAIKHHAK